MQHDRLFLHWMSKQLTKNQYLMLNKIVYSFKKYKSTIMPHTTAGCLFKDDYDHNLVITHLPLFFFDMANISGQSREYLFDQWVQDRIIFWPYEESLELEKARLRLIMKQKEHIATYKYLRIFRETKSGEIIQFLVPKNVYLKCLLSDFGFENWIKYMFSNNCTIENIVDYPEPYSVAHNTKTIIKKITGISNKEYRKYLAEIDKRNIFSNDLIYNYISGDKMMAYNNVNNITKYKFDTKILYNILDKIDNEKVLTVFGESFKIARYDKIISFLIYNINTLAKEDKLKEVKAD